MNYRTRFAAAVRLAAYATLAAMVAQGCGGDDDVPAPAVKPDGGGGLANSGGSGGGTSTNVDGGVKCSPTAAAECLGDRATRICSPEGAWVTVPCGSGEKCSAGACATTQPCTPGDKKCASDGAAKVCDNDGSAWVVTLCGDGKICKDGDCVIDLKGAECTPNETKCVGNSRLRCLPVGRGFESTDCPASAPCVGGQCMGPICAVDQTECSFSSSNRSVVRTCNADGTGFTETVCPAGGQCQFNNLTGKSACGTSNQCQFQGQRVCGDPADPSVDATKLYNECRFSPTNGSLSWAAVQCSAPASCDPANPGCSATCLPGESRCAGTLATQTCGADGKWGETTQCNSGSSTALACRMQGGAALKDGGIKAPGAECVDRVCALLSGGFVSGGGGGSFDGGFGGFPGAGGRGSSGGFGGGFGGPNFPTGPATGVCDGNQIRTCSPEGVLMPAADCKVGTCRATTAGNIDGYHPGLCSNECKAGESRCVTDGLPLFMTCAADNTWSSQYQTCSKVCTTAMDPAGLRTVLCGDECMPGSTRCDGDKVQTCGDGKTWLQSVACTVGRCSMATGTAICLADCLPGATVCTGDFKVASDGLNLGTSASATCSSKGVLPATATNCTGTQACRTGRNGTALGCVECLGPNVAGGNDTGLVDSRCTQSGTGVQTCNAQNNWATATDCGANASCFIGKQRTCGQCPFGVFSNGACTETFLRQNFFNGACPNFGLGVSQQCGSTPDCCSAACTATGTGFAFCAPNDFSPCLSGSSATELDNTSLPLSVPGTTILGDDTFQPQCGFGATPDTAYTFTAPATSTYAFDTFGSNIDTVLSLKDMLVCDEVACNDDAFGSFASRVVKSLSAGQRILVVVDGRGDYTLNVADVGAAGCGNGIIDDSNEQCDGSDFAGLDCFNATFGSLPFGTLSCTSSCTLDTSSCSAGSDGGVGGFGGGFGGFGGLGGKVGAGGRVSGAGGIIIGFDASPPPPPGPSP